MFKSELGGLQQESVFELHFFALCFMSDDTERKKKSCEINNPWGGGQVPTPHSAVLSTSAEGEDPTSDPLRFRMNNLTGTSRSQNNRTWTDYRPVRLTHYLSDSATWKEPWERARKKVGLLSRHPAACD